MIACKQPNGEIASYTPAPIQSKEVAEQRLKAANINIIKEIIKLTENVYTAVGYDVSNITMVVGKDSIILIDAGMIPAIYKEPATKLAKAIGKSPIKKMLLIMYYLNYSI